MRKRLFVIGKEIVGLNFDVFVLWCEEKHWRWCLRWVFGLYGMRKDI
jgi:hypothetical protein